MLFGTKFGAAIVQERPLFKKYFFNLNFAAIIRERPLFKSDHYWRGYGMCHLARYGFDDTDETKL